MLKGGLFSPDQEDIPDQCCYMKVLNYNGILFIQYKTLSCSEIMPDKICGKNEEEKQRRDKCLVIINKHFYYLFRKIFGSLFESEK